MTLQEFFAMGNHGFYVWWSYGLTLLVIVLLFIGFAWYKKQLLNKIKSFKREIGQKARSVKTEKISD
ncbi:heme exporter protein CcmD [Kangiella sp. HZ709]|uniref:heme exporter protein CcmD n=1 Tax=Kangiella sp. HZ709 TaxID=2666328 RepID=UPI0012B1267B|nr:heme exporter protein CcmD [Kangiella sp. HZ709]MRX26564.1 heme exporter protein CcmD [Kangiella sp. HZ709]